MFQNLVANDYKSHVVVNKVVTSWLISINVSQLQHLTIPKPHRTKHTHYRIKKQLHFTSFQKISFHLLQESNVST